MKLLQLQNYDELSRIGAEIIIDEIKHNMNANICLATGGSPKKLYEQMVQQINEERIDISNVTFTKLDEWYDVDPKESFTCETFIQENILDKLYMQPKQFISFVSNALDIDLEVQRIQKLIDENPIDIMILGLGMNGHLGLNEPNDELTLPCHYAALDTKTKTHDMADGRNLEGGLTIGMKGIFDAKKILFLVSGDKKEDAYHGFMKKTISTNLPASFLWLHKNCITLIDKEQFTN
ncbi:galactosamine-6-phosphate isomerase [Breznakia sp. PF5-3]|uniref:6-phosphogluconolactonase n=1 Tax=unclassified Breznakia TaxID=2623764 RepID=UPI00240565F2|nr:MULTISPECIES: 6-phosphogluconolactonase [unclassified Breznakia]MDF9824818.1 galactosamine-6-phosphate isomerase [Breznakia sp. PM6-1]MDF9835220.1 galactosamine-6-phosphate isomerase [Breznakia sp. PF5-3]MDF9837332.1 galactosamine-6-phosphate isomerase [Breznakia sp. PFB2-8]MDF9859744.1 galactosamine-6-phosphate isomerase [Breznakia sp. PH5-24]